MQKISVKTLIAGALVVLLIMLMGVGLLGYLGERKAATYLEDVNNISALQSSSAARAETNLMEMRVRLERLSQHYQNGMMANVDDALTSAKESLAVSDARIEAMNSVPTGPDDERFSYLSTINDTYNAAATSELRSMLASADIEGLIDYKETINPAFLA
ncbi:MAG TPA: methyl-accepting chemotaxis protein, partial [Halomonas sp.]|nr:methyl-accepting chemotaxis protein [Halomonas sp.]